MDNGEFDIYNSMTGVEGMGLGQRPGRKHRGDEEDNESPVKKQFIKGIIIGCAVTLAAVLVIGWIFYGSVKKRIDALNEAEREKVVGEDIDLSQTVLSDILDKPTIDKMINIYNCIATSYLHKYDLDEVQESVVKGLVSGLGDVYTAYYNVSESKALEESIIGEFNGIGVLMQTDMESGTCVIVQVYDDTPAKEQGMQTGDIIYKVNGEEMTGRDVNYIASLIRGEEGTSVDITLLRNGKEIEVTCKRAPITEQTVSSQMLDGNVGYIQITAFDTITYSQFKEHFDGIMAQNPAGLIIDLRNNGGGDVDTTVGMLDEMVGEGIAVYFIDREGKRRDYTTQGKDDLKIPVTVLVNQYSASASEIFTGCLRDRLGAKVVGVTTYGKGVAQTMVPFDDGTMLKMTIAEYFTPNDYEVNEKGIDPDYEVYDDYETEADEQLEEAIRVTLEE